MTPRTAKTFLSLALVLLAVTAFAREGPYIIGPGDVLSVTIFAGGKTQEAQSLPRVPLTFPFWAKSRPKGCPSPNSRKTSLDL
jgi:hypothetical protein